LPVHLTSSHADVGLLTVGNDFFEAQLAAVAEYGDKCNEHRALP
jgi:hypothetical protein